MFHVSNFIVVQRAYLMLLSGVFLSGEILMSSKTFSGGANQPESQVGLSKYGTDQVGRIPQVTGQQHRALNAVDTSRSPEPVADDEQ